MTQKTNFLENELIDHVLRNLAYSSPTAVFVGLFTAAPGEAGGGTEVTGGSYARQQVTFSAPSDGATSNSSQITFPQATASWGTVTHAAIFDAVTTGNMLYYATLTTSRLIDNTDTARITAGDLDIAET